MEYARIAQQHIEDLRRNFTLNWYVVALDGSCVCVCVHACVRTCVRACVRVNECMKGVCT